jgi:ABC-type phosphate transport system substrate-binding protein
MAQTKAGISCSRHLIMQATMVVFTFIFFAAKPARSVTTQSSDQATVIEMHGSGTTNPSKYFWKAMDRLEERARKPVRMTYRGVGSTTGQVEFIGYDQATATIWVLSKRERRASSVSVRRGEFFSQRRRG